MESFGIGMPTVSTNSNQGPGSNSRSKKTINHDKKDDSYVGKSKENRKDKKMGNL
jgi:hypothetical protein